MSLLDRCKGGRLLEKPVEIERYDDRGSAADLRARIYADLLPAQRDFIDDTSHRIVGYIGGFGSGKSFALAAKAITLGLSSILAPRQWWRNHSFRMIRTVFMPCHGFAALEQWGIDYDFRVSPQPEYLLKLPTGNVRAFVSISGKLFSAFVDRIFHIFLWDEADTSPVETAQKAGEMFLARMRTGKVNQLARWLRRLRDSDTATAPL